VLDAIAIIEELLDRPLEVTHDVAAHGDPRRTQADVTRAVRDLRYRPQTPLREGLAAHLREVRRTGGEMRVAA
jgi:nucleoside-diphosphate-sugar epimerase